jgi:hypothetical protein
VFIAAAVTLGVAALLFLQVLYGRVFFSSSVVMAWFWLSVVPMLVVAYYAAYALASRGGGTPRVGLAWLVGLVFAAIAFVYTNNMTLMLRPDAQHALYAASGRGLWLNVADATLVPRYLHMLAGALGIAGLGVALAGLLRLRVSPSFGAWAVAYGCRWFVIASAVNVAIGAWFLVALPRDVVRLFMGRDAYATGVLVAGIAAGVAAIACAEMARRSASPARPFGAAAGLAIVTLLLMVLTRDTVRTRMLAGAGLEPAVWVQPQWGPVAIFAVLLVAAVILVGWMVTALVRAPQPTAGGVAHPQRT